MKYLFSALVLLSLSSFASANNGYNCIAKTESDQALLSEIAPQLGDDYLNSIQVLFVRNCNESTCKSGPYTVNVDGKEAELVLSSSINIKLLCDVNGGGEAL